MRAFEWLLPVAKGMEAMKLGRGLSLIGVGRKPSAPGTASDPGIARDMIPADASGAHCRGALRDHADRAVRRVGSVARERSAAVVI